MSNKNNISSILGVAAATVLAGGGSAFVTGTGLNMLDNNHAIVQETDVAIAERETELPITVETFTASKDSFTVKPVSETEKKAESDKKDTSKKTEADRKTETNETGEGEHSDNSTSAAAVEGTAGTENPIVMETEGSRDNTNAGSSSANTGSNDQSVESRPDSADMTPVSYDEWGGWTASNGDYFDGQGGYWDGNGYHYVGDSIKKPPVAQSDNPSYSDGSSSGSNNGGWDDSYILYDTSVRYLSRDELSNWGSWDLAAARNEIFARHGRIFYTDEWKSYFATKSWYNPRYENVDDQLSDVEWANLELIMKLEEKFY